MSEGGGIHMAADLETNKINVAEFYDLIINKKDFESARKFMGTGINNIILT